MGSSSSQNTRVFAPTVILQNDSRRLQIVINTSQTDGNITVGDAIRWDPSVSQYVRSQANFENTAEVVGIVESIDGSNITVVTFGSINYPTNRLNAIIQGNLADSTKDVLFLDYAYAGGLTGQVEIPAGTNTAVVKPVMQIAPHGNGAYNGLVLNYLGYKIGNSASLTFTGESLGGILQQPEGSDPGPNYLKMDQDRLVSVTENPNLYDFFGTSNGVFTVALTMSSSANVTSALVGKTVTQNLTNGSGVLGTVKSVSGAVVNITCTQNSLAPLTGRCTINGTAFTIIGFNTVEFTIPAYPPTQVGNTTFNYWINTSPLTKVTVPESLTIQDLTVTGVLELGSVTDVETKLADLTTQINAIKTRLGMS